MFSKSVRCVPARPCPRVIVALQRYFTVAVPPTNRPVPHLTSRRRSVWRHLPRVIAFALAASFGLAQVEAQPVGPEVRVSLARGWQCEPDAAAFGDSIVAVWTNESDLSAIGTAWGYSRDGGMTWTDRGEWPTPS